MSLFATAFALNLIWEIGHRGLYQDYLNFIPAWLCLIFAVAIDTVLVAMIVWFSKQFKYHHWAMIVSGLATAVFIEKLALSLDWWGYAADMPMVFGLGISPILQMALLPALTVFIIKKFKVYGSG